MGLREFERKFVFLPSLLNKFHNNQGQPPFHLLLHKANVTFRDTYFDTARVLASRDIWIRKRDEKWEAKIPVPTVHVRGDWVNTAYEEFTSVERIHKLVCKHLPESPGVDRNFGLKVWCDFITYRKNYLADEKFTVVLDTTNFGHAVGEVELMAKPEDAAIARGDIDRFLERYAWFFQKGTPKGKITAYLEKFGTSGTHGC